MRHDEDMPDTGIQTPPTLRSITPEDMARAALTGAVAELGRTEVRVLARFAERLATAARTGSVLATVPCARSFLSHKAQREIDEALIYLWCAWIKAETLEVTR
jgi:hypothetical protein